MVGIVRGRRFDWVSLPFAGMLLGVAGVIVGAAILVGGDVARALNGIGAICWLVGGLCLVLALRAGGWRWPSAAVALAAVVLMALVVRPGELLVAAGGFLLAGALVAGIAGDRPLGWALLVPALWLPVHLSLAIGRSLFAGGGRIRTDPPPTAALVPLTMIAAAAAAGWAVGWWRDRQKAPTTPPAPAVRDEPAR